MKKLIITLLVIAGIACLVLPKILGTKGSEIHNQYFQERAQEMVPGLSIQSEELNNGWFKSEGQHRLSINESFVKNMFPGVKQISFEDEVDVLVNTKFHHGPLAFTAFGSKASSFSPVLAVAESTFKIEADGKQIEVPGTLYTQVNATGSGGKARYTIEAFSHQADDATIEFEGLDFDFDISDKGEAVNGVGKTGKFSVVGNNGEKMTMNGLKFDADLDDSLGVWIGDGSFSLADMSFDAGNGQSFSLSNLNLSSDSDGNEKTIDSNAKFSIGSFDISGMTFEDFTFDIDMDNFDTQAIIAMEEATKGAVPDQAALMESLKQMVAKSPKIDINELSVVTPQGKVEADLHFGLPDEVDMGFFPLSLLPQIQGDANIRVPVAVIEFASAMQPGLAQQAQGLQQAGMLSLDGEDYVAVFKMSEGSMTLNGNPLPIPGMF